jgi:hypothetical protein
MKTFFIISVLSYVALTAALCSAFKLKANHSDLPGAVGHSLFRNLAAFLGSFDCQFELSHSLRRSYGSNSGPTSSNADAKRETARPWAKYVALELSRQMKIRKFVFIPKFRKVRFSG